MAGKLRIDFRDVFAADGNALVEIYLSSHVQATMPAPIERLIIETTIVANLELAQKDPPIWFSSRQLPGRPGVTACNNCIAGAGLARLRRDGRFSLEVVISGAWLRRGIATSLLIALNRRCLELGASEACAHVFAENKASIGLVQRLGFGFRSKLEGGRMLEFVKALP